MVPFGLRHKETGFICAAAGRKLYALQGVIMANINVHQSPGLIAKFECFQAMNSSVNKNAD